MRSLRVRLIGLWALSLAACLAAGVLLVQLSRQTTDAQVARASAAVARACGLIGDRFDFYTAGWDGTLRPVSGEPFRRDLANAVGLALEGQDGVEGGIWQADAGPLAYAFPTYRGTGPKTDLPEAERAQIEAVNAQAARDEQPVDRRTVSGPETLLLHACPLNGPIPGVTAWTMARVRAAPGLGPLRGQLSVLLVVELAMSILLFRTLRVWARHVRGIEAALSGAGTAGIPTLAPTGERELDRIVGALNDAGRRLAAAREESEALAARVARAERMAALGRVAAGVAHEIRNPLAAARLQGENALAGDDARRRGAIGDMLTEIGRLETLVAELLAMTQRVEPRPGRVALAPFLEDVAARHRTVAAARGILLAAEGAAGEGVFDAAIVGRILDNLLSNAIRHAAEGGRVTLAAERSTGMLAFVVADTGAGVPRDMAGRLFEPFATGRADGTGLGLAIARELADAHHGRLVLRRAGGDGPGRGAEFALELEGASCPSS